eukprot:CAMPEP_0175513356 /NCGR_PEP_ID=MMETSP0096-20121207/12871_1 /TAXON_ID=311494 /ORGANISM="Alexandrium monilatum, Strain CCMP3105" /LENGTH=264 /DNA_ID=CAMNT_0016815579 /DNA_START=30 /DNA_END=824 /DNA_ORIENTATION=+
MAHRDTLRMRRIHPASQRAMARAALLIAASAFCCMPCLAWVTSPPGGATVRSQMQTATRAQAHSGAIRVPGHEEVEQEQGLWRVLAATALSLAVLFGAVQAPARAQQALISSKIKAGGASTSGGQGTKKIITRGINLEKANYSKQDLSGVSFQQSIVREANFKDAKLVGTSFFDADLAGTDFTGAEMTQANLELARCTDAIFTNAVATDMYVNGTTKMEPKRIDGADFSGTLFRKDQLNYLCKIAEGTNPVTKVDTRESLMCPE